MNRTLKKNFGGLNVPKNIIPDTEEKIEKLSELVGAGWKIHFPGDFKFFKRKHKKDDNKSEIGNCLLHRHIVQYRKYDLAMRSGLSRKVNERSNDRIRVSSSGRIRSYPLLILA
ncbi:hypothetical protein WUBG_02798 [Wuchereria bancrofti]|uniref:Uncharacterized protein n=1 Tax=Wuchereria bancrofti TaxID=6293 RepID=J9EUM5_WUCBA|nr:hypothetical protein WUBG_02798 [Wuchereria bancrofti]